MSGFRAVDPSWRFGQHIRISFVGSVDDGHRFMFLSLLAFELSSSHWFARQHYYLLFTFSFTALCILPHGYNVYFSSSFRSNTSDTNPDNLLLAPLSYVNWLKRS